MRYTLTIDTPSLHGTSEIEPGAHVRRNLRFDPGCLSIVARPAIVCGLSHPARIIAGRMFRLSTWQIDRLAAARGTDPISCAEAHLRAHYPEQCAAYDAAALRAWIANAVKEVTAHGLVSTDEVLVQISVRWVLRAWFGSPITE